MAGLRDLDEAEARAIKEDGIQCVSEEDLLDPAAAARTIMPPMVARQDAVYIHVDLDILDPELAPAAGLPTAGGLSGRQLGDFLGALMIYPKVRVLSVVSYRAHDDRDGALGAVRDGAQVADDLIVRTRGRARLGRVAACPR